MAPLPIWHLWLVALMLVDEAIVERLEVLLRIVVNHQPPPVSRAIQVNFGAQRVAELVLELLSLW